MSADPVHVPQAVKNTARRIPSVMASHEQIAAANAELARRRVMVVVFLGSFVLAVASAAVVAVWLAALVGILGAVVSAMVVARYRYLVAAVGSLNADESE
jgi:membrane associated rhomboid family serine protease